MGLKHSSIEEEQEEQEVVKKTVAPSSSSELHEFEADLQATLGALEHHDLTHTPDEDKVHTCTHG